MATFETVDAAAALLRRSRPRLVGIAGAPGAGKSTLAVELVRRLDSAALLPMDGFHLPQARLVELGRRERMGAPDTFDVAAFVDTLRALRERRGPVSAPGFDREREEPVPLQIIIEPGTTTVVIEGNYLLLDSGGWEQVADLLDVTFFVQVDDDIRRSRLIARHERYGKTSADARAWTLGPDEANARLIAGTARRADHLLAN